MAFVCLAKATHPPVPKGQYQDGQNTNQKCLHLFQVLKVLLIKICKIQSLDLLFLAVSVSFYISRYHFSQVFRTSFNIVWKKDFHHKFSFLNGFTQTRSPPPPYQPKSAKRDKSFLSMLPNLSWFFKITLWWR